MPIYETVFIARQELSTAQVDELTQTFSKVITDAKGKILKTENWGLRTLAYRIEKNRKGHYVLIESETPSDAIIEMERQMRLHDNILRYMSIKLLEPSKDESPILKKSEDSYRDNSRSDHSRGDREAA